MRKVIFVRHSFTEKGQIMDHLYDEFAKSLARAVPRRESLRRMGALVAGAALAPFGLGTAWAAGDPCKSFCRCSNKAQQNQCLAACRACNNNPTRLCGGCGSYACCGAGTTCCGNACVDLQNDFDHCGTCGNPCDPPGPYEEGACVYGACLYRCVEGAIVCDGFCTPVNSDPYNCGACGNVCAEPTPYCNQGACSMCPPGLTQCGDYCMNLAWDNANCGACGWACDFSTSCVAGVCQPNEPYVPE